MRDYRVEDRPALQSAHIRPVASGGKNRLDNGLLLRSDVHAMFDGGYLTLVEPGLTEVWHWRPDSGEMMVMASDVMTLLGGVARKD